MTCCKLEHVLPRADIHCLSMTFLELLGARPSSSEALEQLKSTPKCMFCSKLQQFVAKEEDH